MLRKILACLPAVLLVATAPISSFAQSKTETSELTTGTNREKAVCHQGGALLAKKLRTGAAPKGAARRETKNPTNKRLRK